MARTPEFLLTIDGTTMSANRWADETGRTEAIILRRKRAGMSDRESVFYEKRRPAPVKLTVDGVSLSAYKWSIITGRSATTMLRRKALGFSDRDCVYFKGMKTKKDRTFIEYKGVTRSVNGWAKLRRIDPKVIFERMKYTDDPEKLTAPARRKKTLTMYGETRGIREWSELHGLLEITVRHRLNRGLSIEDAFKGGKYVKPKKDAGI